MPIRRRELTAVQEVLVARERLAMSAARIAPPPYVLAELGRRPTNLAEARAWDRGVAVIETYRRDNGVTDQTSALDPEPKEARPRCASGGRWSAPSGCSDSYGMRRCASG